MVENLLNHFRCELCNKNYKDKSGLWYHNNKYHNNTHNTIDNTIYDKQIILNKYNTLDNTLDNTLESKLTKLEIEKNIDYKYFCKKCNKKFNNYQNRWKHEKICKSSSENFDTLLKKNTLLENTIKQQLYEIDQMKTLMIEQNAQMKKQIIEIKNQLIETMNKNCKVHPKTLQKINKQLNCDNINNGTINNTYNIIGLGHENLTEVFSKKEKMAILKNRFYCLPELVEYAHFNDKYPQFKNILITNTQNTLAYKYDTKKKQFVAVNKDELLDDIVDERMCDINSFYDELENDLDERTKEIIEKVKDKIENDPAYKELKKKDIKLIIYNNRKKVIKDNILIEDEIDV